MSSRRKKQRATTPAKTPHRSRTGLLKWTLGVVLIGGLTSGACLLRDRAVASQSSAPKLLPGLKGSASNPAPVVSAKRPDSLTELLSLSPEDLAPVDIARANLLCATDLPGSEKLDIGAALGTLDRWAEQVRTSTLKQLPQFYKDPSNYQNSEAYYRILAMITVLQLDLGVKYNDARKDMPNFRDSRDLFIHGMLGYGDGGTCASLPVLYVAVGRRLGYPLKLVLAKEHVFCRWEGGGERFNIEGSGRGLLTPPDSYYWTWPVPIPEQERGLYLKSLSPRQELADALASRGHCLSDNGKLQDARDCYVRATSLSPHPYVYFLQRADAELQQMMQAGIRPRSPIQFAATPLPKGTTRWQNGPANRR